jgi:hypothetical protein
MALLVLVVLRRRLLRRPRRLPLWPRRHPHHPRLRLHPPRLAVPAPLPLPQSTTVLAASFASSSTARTKAWRLTT